MKIVSLTIAGDHNENYTVSLEPSTGAVTCTCLAYFYSRKHPKRCKHISFAAEALSGSRAGNKLAAPDEAAVLLWANEKPEEEKRCPF